MRYRVLDTELSVRGPGRIRRRLGKLSNKKYHDLGAPNAAKDVKSACTLHTGTWLYIILELGSIEWKWPVTRQNVLRQQARAALKYISIITDLDRIEETKRTILKQRTTR